MAAKWIGDDTATAIHGKHENKVTETSSEMCPIG